MRMIQRIVRMRVSGVVPTVLVVAVMVVIELRLMTVTELRMRAGMRVHVEKSNKEYQQRDPDQAHGWRV